MKPFIFILSISVALLYVVDCATNCGVGYSVCNKCGANSKVLEVMIKGKRYTTKVCCKSCNKYFRAGYKNEAAKLGPYCSCTYEGVVGNCWKGDVCNTCGHGYVGNINGLPVCCKDCEKSGLSLSPTSCFCLHNGP